MKETKGITTKKYILDSSREIFNSKGINLTLDLIAKELNITKGKITNHFSTKDNLFLAIISDYQDQFQQLYLTHKTAFESVEFHSVVFFLSKVMDIQYEYRCGIVYLNMLSPSQSDLILSMQTDYKKNIEIIKYRISKMVAISILNKEILEDDSFNSFLLIYVTMLTQWVVNYEMFDRDKSYSQVKSFYLKSILRHSYYPYFTKKGLKAFEALNFNQD